MLSQNLPGGDRRMPSGWYRWGGVPAVQHWWDQSPDGEMWRTLCTAHVVGDKHRSGLETGIGHRNAEHPSGFGKTCVTCSRIKYEGRREGRKWDGR